MIVTQLLRLMITCLFSKTFLFLDWVFQSFEVICVWQISITSGHKLVADAMRNARLTSFSKLYAYHASLDPIFWINTNPMLRGQIIVLSQESTPSRCDEKFSFSYLEVSCSSEWQCEIPNQAPLFIILCTPPNRDFWLTQYTPAYCDVIIHKLPLGIFCFTSS